MAPLCLLYFIAVGSWLGAAGLLTERALPTRAPRRWIWGLTIATSIALPMVLSARHSSHVIGLWGHELLRIPSASPAVGTGATPASALHNWLDCGAAYGSIVMRIWLAGSALLLAWGLANAWRLHRLLGASRSASREAAVIDGVEVTITRNLGPATTGLWRPRVLLPRWALALPAERRRYVVRHEDEHRRAHDAALLAVASVFVALMPWNVPLWWHLRRLRLAVEMDCDRRVVASLGDALGYGALLVDVAAAASHGPRLQPALLGGSGMLERRLTALVGAGRRGIVEWVVAPVLAITLVAIVLSVPHPELGRSTAPDVGGAGGARASGASSPAPLPAGSGDAHHHAR